MQRHRAGHHRRQGRGNLRVAGVGQVFHAIDYKPMNLGAEGAAHLSRVAGKFDHRAARRCAGDLEAVRLQPRRHGLYVGIGRAELLTELLRRQPLMIIGRRFALLLVEQRAQRRFLSGRALQQQKHPANGLAVGYGALIEPRPRERMGIAPPRDPVGLINLLRDPRRNGTVLSSEGLSSEGGAAWCERLRTCHGPERQDRQPQP